jgi:hypothetical protein
MAEGLSVPDALRVWRAEHYGRIVHVSLKGVSLLEHQNRARVEARFRTTRDAVSAVARGSIAWRPYVPPEPPDTATFYARRGGASTARKHRK